MVGRPRILDQTVDAHARRSEVFAQALAGGVGADRADERRAAAEHGDVVRDVGRAAQPQVLRLEANDRDRRLGRDARDAPDDEAIEHDVADDEDRQTGERATISRATIGESACAS